MLFHDLNMIHICVFLFQDFEPFFPVLFFLMVSMRDWFVWLIDTKNVYMCMGAIDIDFKFAFDF